MTDALFRTSDADHDWALLRQMDDYGLHSFYLVRPPGRFWSDQEFGQSSPVRMDVDARRTTLVPTPARLLAALPEGDNWQAMTRRSVGRLAAWFILVEDPQRRLEAKAISTLAHQASLVRFVLSEPNLQNVLIADEVGLGKTIEAALIIKELLSAQKNLRVLYLAPARLVSNVRQEFLKLGLRFRVWVAGQERDATFDDPLVIASVHRAAHGAHLEAFVNHTRWDVVVVDECHHLSAWAKDGGDPVRKYKLVDELRKRLGPSGRLILMSGTPHQGHAARFENVLRLLRRDGEEESELKGRVIYRTKDDVRGWDGGPVFPKRQVNAPITIDLGSEHRRWIESIHDFFQPDESSAGSAGQARRRAAGWRCGMALQWATSSIQAGLGFMVRQALRARWEPERAELRAALEMLRPYRGGPPNEAISVLFHRIRQEIQRQEAQADVEDIEDEVLVVDDDRWLPDPQQLAALLREGVALLRADPDAKWRALQEQVLSKIGGEKVVLFAQPIETVTAVAGYLARQSGKQPALIVGSQNQAEREQVIQEFWQANGPRYLVSSRAGSEGINLQVARHLVHLDVPWNPMELEQRVGRVHRFKSRRTVIVDTLVVKDSREVHMYRVAREKLSQIAATLVEPERFEALFSRVMALVAPEELLDVLAARPLGPLTEDERERVSNIVTAGFARHQAFHAKYTQAQEKIRALDPGQATWDDLGSFVSSYASGSLSEGFKALGFRSDGDEVVEDPSDARVFQVQGNWYACGDYGGMPVFAPDGRQASPLGTNVPIVSEQLRHLAFPDKPAGAAHLRWPDNRPVPIDGLAPPFGVLLLARQSVRVENDTWVELHITMHGYVVRLDATVSIAAPARAALIRGLLASTIRRDPEDAPALLERLQKEEDALLAELRQPSLEEQDAGIRAAVTPLVAAIVS